MTKYADIIKILQKHIIYFSMNGDIKMGTSTVSKSEEVYDLIKKSMDAASLRRKVIANNIANYNTKDYKGYYVNFEDTLKKVLMIWNLRQVRTNI